MRGFLFLGGCVSAAAQNINAMRDLLAMPSRDQSLWMRMQYNQRRALLMMSGLPMAWYCRRWESFTQRERLKLLNQVHEAGQWVNKLQGPA